MSKILKYVALFLVIAGVVFVAGCANKQTSNVTTPTNGTGVSGGVSSEGANQSVASGNVPAQTITAPVANNTTVIEGPIGNETEINTNPNLPQVTEQEPGNNTSDRNVKWIINSNNIERVVLHDITNCSTSLGNLDWQSVSISADKIAVDSQKAIDLSNSYEVSSDFQSVKDEYNLAMEQAIQFAKYVKLGAEEAQKGNREGMDFNFYQAADYRKSFNQHTHSVYDQEMICLKLWHEGDMAIIASMGDNTWYYYPNTY